MKKISKLLFLLFLSFISIQGVSAATKLAECSYSFSIAYVKYNLTISIDDSGKLTYSIPDGEYFSSTNIMHYKNFDGYADALYKDGKLSSSCPNLSLGKDNNGAVYLYYGRESSSLEEDQWLDEVQSLEGKLKIVNSSASVDNRKEKEYCTLSREIKTGKPIKIRFYDDIDGNHMFEVSDYYNANIKNRAKYNGVTTIEIFGANYTVFMDADWNNISSYWSNDCSKSKIYLYTPDGDPKRFYITTKEINDGSLNASTSDDNDDGSSYTDKNEQKDEQVDPEKLAYNLDLIKYCNDAGFLRTFKFIGILIYLTKIFVPALIIIFGSIDFGKAILAGKEDEIQKKLPIVIKRFIAGVIIFFIPTILNFLFNSLEGYNEAIKKYNKCYTCILDPSDCSIP